MARPSKYTPELAKEICKRIMDGNSLSKIARADDMPSRDTIHTWLANDKDFSDNYARACKIRRENRFEDLEEIVDTVEDVQRARLKVDVIKWQLSKEEPKKYGDNSKLDLHVKELPTPILGGASVVHSNDSDAQAPEA